MFRNRRTRLTTVLFALLSLLFMQVAIASYACPVDTAARVAQDATMADMPCAGEMAQDPEQPGLCHVYCHPTQNVSADKAQTPTLSAVVATGFVYTLAAAPVAKLPGPPSWPSLDRTTAPPLQVRNCCFRI